MGITNIADIFEEPEGVPDNDVDLPETSEPIVEDIDLPDDEPAESLEDVVLPVEDDIPTEDVDLPEGADAPSEDVDLSEIVEESTGDIDLPVSEPTESIDDVVLPAADSTPSEDIDLPEAETVADVEMDIIQEPEREDALMSSPDTNSGLLAELRMQTDLLRQLLDKEGLS